MSSGTDYRHSARFGWSSITPNICWRYLCDYGRWCTAQLCRHCNRNPCRANPCGLKILWPDLKQKIVNLTIGSYQVSRIARVLGIDLTHQSLGIQEPDYYASPVLRNSHLRFQGKPIHYNFYQASSAARLDSLEFRLIQKKENSVPIEHDYIHQQSALDTLASSSCTAETPKLALSEECDDAVCESFTFFTFFVSLFLKRSLPFFANFFRWPTDVHQVPIVQLRDLWRNPPDNRLRSAKLLVQSANAISRYFGPSMCVARRFQTNVLCRVVNMP